MAVGVRVLRRRRLIGRFAARDRAGASRRHAGPRRRCSPRSCSSSPRNCAVWAASSIYPHDARGLLACFAAALPFFRNSLAGDAFTAAGLFGAFAFAERRWPALRRTAST